MVWLTGLGGCREVQEMGVFLALEGRSAAEWIECRLVEVMDDVSVAFYAGAVFFCTAEQPDVLELHMQGRSYVT
jgi:hypothetical protein